VHWLCLFIFIPKHISQVQALRIVATKAIVGSFLVVLTPPEISIIFVSLMALGCSLMWPSLMVIAIVGGAVFPTNYGFLKDAVGAQNAYWLVIPSFLYMLYYGVKGHKIR
jgi:fucose permease